MNRTVTFAAIVSIIIVSVTFVGFVAGWFPLKLEKPTPVETRVFEGQITNKTDVPEHVISVKILEVGRTLFFRYDFFSGPDPYRDFVIGDFVLVECDVDGKVYSIKHIPLFEVER